MTLSVGISAHNDTICFVLKEIGQIASSRCVGRAFAPGRTARVQIHADLSGTSRSDPLADFRPGTTLGFVDYTGGVESDSMSACARPPGLTQRPRLHRDPLLATRRGDQGALRGDAEELEAGQRQPGRYRLLHRRPVGFQRLMGQALHWQVTLSAAEPF